MTRLVLHNYWRSSASYRARIGLGVKRLAYEYAVISVICGDQHTPAYRAVNPMQQVPTLEVITDHGERIAITQSLAILAFIDEHWPDPPLLPHDIYRRAHTRALAELINAGIQPLHNTGVLDQVKAFGGDADAWAHRFISKGLAAFDALCAETAGAFCVGDAVTLADVCLVPQLFGARRYDIDLSRWPRLLDIEARCLEIPAFLDAAPDRQPDSPRSTT